MINRHVWDLKRRKNKTEDLDWPTRCGVKSEANG